MVFQVDGSSRTRTELVSLRTGVITQALNQFIMEPNYVHSPDGRLMAGTALNGDEVVWDENPTDTPVTIPTPDNRSSVTLAPHELLIAEPAGLFVVPDAYCGPLNQVVALAEKLLVRPTALAEAATYNNS
jgi:hypothetical protein